MARDRRLRAWWLAVGVGLMGLAPGLAATRVSIPDLKEYPERYYDQAVLLECYYDKESPIWVRALPDADEWIGFFVTGKPEKTVTWSGEYYNLLFAPYAMRDAVRSLRGGDKITLIGSVFPYHSASFDGGGIRVQQILSGWGASAKLIGQAAAPPVSATPSAAGGERPEAMPPSRLPTPGVAAKYAVTMNGKRYEGLRFGDAYHFDGVEFQVDEPQPD